MTNPLGHAYLGTSKNGGFKVKLSKLFVTNEAAPAGPAIWLGGVRVIATADATTYVGLRAANGALYINAFANNPSGAYGLNGALNVGEVI